MGRERGGSGLALPHLEIISLLTVKRDSLDEAPFDYAQDRLRRIRDAKRICSPDFILAMKLKIQDPTLFPSRHRPGQ